MEFFMKVIDSPIGVLTLMVTKEAVIGLGFGDLVGENEVYSESVNYGIMGEATWQLGEYFAGRLRDFDLPIKPCGTEFQKRVWQSLLSIPYGETRSYREIAEMCGSSKGFRAVGMANNRNPIVIFIPCHRVIGADGGMTGYGGGLDRKKFLLGLEKG